MTSAPRQHPTGGDDNRLLTLAVILSLTGHVLLFTLSHVFTTSGYKPHKTPRSIDVDLMQTEQPVKKPAKVSKSKKQTAAPAAKAKPSTAPNKKATRKKSEKKVQTPVTKTISGKKSVKRKHKVITPDELVQSALEKMARETSSPEPLSERMNRLKQEVADTKAPPAQPSSGTSDGQPTAAQISVKERYYRTIEVIIRKNWAYPVQMVGTNTQLKTQIIFTVMPDGSVRDVWVSQRSGNASFDRSALSAVHKSTPLPPYPAGITDRKMPFVIDFDISELL
ncbi:energy transducer TonB [Desulfoluna butyratoxydans]|uniref:Tonb c-terminal n=1 Tax=Desulfoluna butyratoxydans TaxID=231438 RepID=A0A4U8YMR7_9BACT|nr:TonB family protein [Desulfoluna butyratoxydans]VFQ42912.1 tonb c-terminal [Desulfoluna butyratoxydans]